MFQQRQSRPQLLRAHSSSCCLPTTLRPLLLITACGTLFRAAPAPAGLRIKTTRQQQGQQHDEGVSHSCCSFTNSRTFKSSRCRPCRPAVSRMPAGICNCVSSIPVLQPLIESASAHSPQVLLLLPSVPRIPLCATPLLLRQPPNSTHSSCNRPRTTHQEAETA